MQILRELMHLFRKFLLRTRLKTAGRIFENLPFSVIESKYQGRAANKQLENWRTVFVENGKLYSYYDTIDGVRRCRITAELNRRIFLATEAGIYSGRGIVYNPYYNCTVLETLETWGSDVNYSTEFVKIRKNPLHTLHGLSVSLLSLGAISNYAHFLFDSITRLSLLRKLDIEPDRFLVSGPKTAWKEKILTYLQINDRVHWVNDNDEIKCEQLLFTSRVNFSRHVSPYAIEGIRSIFLPHNLQSSTTASRIIFASRKNAADRKNRFEDWIHDHLPPFVEVVDFEKMSMEETMHICQECRLFFGIHGAAFSNVVFCQSRIKIVEFQIAEVLPEWHRNYYETLYQYLDFDYEIKVVPREMSESAFQKMVQEILTNALARTGV